MKHFKSFFWYATIALFFVVSACGESGTEQEDAGIILPEVDEFETLMSYIEWTGDYINSVKAPTLITVDEVYENLGGNIVVLDTRSPEAYAQGHIDGAKNVEYTELLSFLLNECYPSRYDMLVLVCYSGQSSSYAASILQMLGYRNAYAMKWGMSGWNRTFAEDKWLARTSNEYAGQLEKQSNSRGEANDYPQINTGERRGIEIMEARAQELFEAGFKPVTIDASKVFENPENYYIINYWPAEKYLAGHIPTAIQYTPKQSLKRSEFLNTLPLDKPIVTYCYTGQHSAFVTAYLRLIGYDAYTLVYGANSFMHGVMRDNEKIGKAFSESMIRDYPYITGAQESSGSTEAAPGETPPPPPPPPTNNTNRTQPAGGGGC